MEHQNSSRKSMSKILNFLPRATSSVTFQSPPLYSPNKDKKPSEKPHKSNLGIGFSGPIIPSETRRKIKNHDDSKYTLVYEPTSPRVSCMGQVKCKHYRKLTVTGAGAGTGNVTNKPVNKFSRTTSYSYTPSYNNEEKEKKVDPVDLKSKKKLGFRSLLRGGGGGGSRRKSDATADNVSNTALTIPKGPCLSTMKRFSSGRDVFMNFDWTTQVAPLDSVNRSCGTDGKRDGESNGVGGVAPLDSVNRSCVTDGKRDGESNGVGGVKLDPKKEVNLWKKKTLGQPQPLQLHDAN
ncbi:hypothetical protein SSX86_020592 [Deinandra increscens subsp. villosa]|uniref:Uncharacterized protein n=1 Tax=Deinandra increscens subsp. villosa TaxID=3103831 RepID=A0AAP0CV19_9ASTR